MKFPLGYLTMSLLLLFTPLLAAGQVVLTLPDSDLRAVINQVAIWHHAESEANGGYKSDEEKAQWVANKLIQLISMGHYQGLQSLNADMEIRYDQPREPVVP